MENCFKVTTTLNNTAESVFDLIADIERRTTWDDLVEVAKIVGMFDSLIQLLIVS